MFPICVFDCVSYLFVFPICVPYFVFALVTYSLLTSYMYLCYLFRICALEISICVTYLRVCYLFVLPTDTPGGSSRCSVRTINYYCAGPAYAQYRRLHAIGWTACRLSDAQKALCSRAASTSTQPSSQHAMLTRLPSLHIRPAHHRHQPCLLPPKHAPVHLCRAVLIC